MSEVKRWWVVEANLYENVPGGHIPVMDPYRNPLAFVVLASDYGAVVKERDVLAERLAQRQDEFKAQRDRAIARAEAAEAQVGRVKALPRHFGAYVHPRTTLFVECRDLDRALAGEATATNAQTWTFTTVPCSICNQPLAFAMHGYGRCVERRKKSYGWVLVRKGGTEYKAYLRGGLDGYTLNERK